MADTRKSLEVRIRELEKQHKFHIGNLDKHVRAILADAEVISIGDKVVLKSCSMEVRKKPSKQKKNKLKAARFQKLGK